jgi:hypothetical protein
MNPLLVYKTDGKRLVINLDRVIRFEEINADTIKVMLEGGREYDLKLTFDALTKAMEE